MEFNDYELKMDQKPKNSSQNSSILGRIIFSFTIVKDDLKRKPIAFQLALCSVFVVVATLTFVFSLLFLSQIIFLRMAEDTASDADIILTPSAPSNPPIDLFNTSNQTLFHVQNGILDNFINSRQLNTKLSTLQKHGQLEGIAPRWYLSAKVYNLNKNDQVDVMAILADLVQENNIGFGKNFEFKKPLGNAQAYISQSALDLLGYSQYQGAQVYLFIDLLYAVFSKEQLKGISQNIKNIYVDLNQNKTISRDHFKSELTYAIIKLAKSQKGYSEIITIQEGLDYIFYNNPEVEPNILKSNNNQNKFNRILNSYPNSDYKYKFQEIVFFSSAKIKQQYKHRQLQKTVILKSFNDPYSEILNQKINVTKFIQKIVPILVDIGQLFQNITIQGAAQSPNGKWNQGFGSVILLDLNNFINSSINAFVNNLWNNQIGIINALLVATSNQQNKQALLMTDKLLKKYKQQIQQGLINRINSWNLNEFSMTSNIIVKDKPNFYKYENQLENKLNDLTNEIMAQLGINYRVNLQAPLSVVYLQLSNFQIFFDNLTAIVIFLLAYISGIVIYSLMNFKVHEKTYTYGMLRILGLRVHDVAINLFIESLIFSVLGVGLGLLLAYILTIVAKYILFSYSGEYDQYKLNEYAIMLGLGIGLLVPFLSNIVPIKKALGTQLTYALDLNKRGVEEIGPILKKFIKSGVSPTLTAVSIFIVAISFATFYFVSFFFIYKDFRYLSYILVIILMLLVAGMIIMISYAQTPLGLIIGTIICKLTFQSDGFKCILSKNLKTHKHKNFQIGSLFILSIIFLFLSVSGFNTIAEQLQNTIRQQIGSDLVVQSRTPNGFKEQHIRLFLQKYKKLYPDIIKDFTFTTAELTSMNPSPGDLRITPLAHYPGIESQLIGVYKNYLNCIYENTYVDYETYPNVNQSYLVNDKRDTVADLYSFQKLNMKINSSGLYKPTSSYIYRPNNTNDTYPGTYMLGLLISKSASDTLNTNINQTLLINNFDRPLQAKVVSIAKKIPGYTSVSTNLNSGSYTSLATMRDFAFILAFYHEKWRQRFNITKIENLGQFNRDDIINFLPKARLFIRFKAELDRQQRLNLLNNLKQVVDQEQSTFLDTEEIVVQSQTAVKILNAFFFSVAIICLTLTFFVLLVSLIRNIKESQKEIAILRAVGLFKSQIIRLSIYELTTVLIVATILGIVVGNVVSYLIVNNFSLFNDMDYKIKTSWIFAGVMIFISFLISWVAVRIVVKKIVDQQIAELFLCD